MQEPQLQDFGIRPEEYALYTRKGNNPDDASGLGCLFAVTVDALIVFPVLYLVTRDLAGAVAWSVLALFPLSIVTYGIATLVGPVTVRFKRSRLLKSPVAARIKLYEAVRDVYQSEQWAAENARQEAERERREAAAARWKAEHERRRGLYDHWMSLSGIRFERELATLYGQLGFYVQSTPRSGDQGIDLVLRKHGKTTVVQCKGHKTPIGPAAVRELFGAMKASNAHSAILACTGGFTRGVEEFARGKPITLLSARDLAKLGDSVLGDKQQKTIRTDLFGGRVP